MKHKVLNWESNDFTKEEVGLLQANGGNAAINSKYLAKYLNDGNNQQRDMIQFIKKKYNNKEWYFDKKRNKCMFNTLFW